MKRPLLAALVATGVSLSWFATAHAAAAADPAPAPAPAPSAAPPPAAPPPAAEPPPAAPGGAMPPPQAAAPSAIAEPLPAPSPMGGPGPLRAVADYARPDDLLYGVAMRFRWVTVPSWMLNVFTKKNVPLEFGALPGAYAIEFFRRKANFDILAAVGYQSMSPPDGNWLGVGKEPAMDTDFVQFRSLGIITADISFVWHSMFTDWIGMHYGAGIGAGFRHGEMLRTSSFGCTDSNLGNLKECHPRNIDCSSGTSCNETQLNSTQTLSGADTPLTPRRFTDGSIPAVIPIINAVVGVDFHVPSLKGWEGKIEGGFYDAFFLGGGVAYSF